MIDLAANLINIAAGLGSLICLVLVLIHLFQSDQHGWGVICLILLIFGGIGALVAFVKGWLDGLGTVMWVWTGCILLAAVVNSFLR